MTSATAPAPTNDPQEALAQLRAWTAKHCGAGHPIRDSALAMARSALVHRLLKYGPDETLNTCSARDLLSLTIFTNGAVAEYLIRTSYIRALIEGDYDLTDYLNTTLFIPDIRAWYWQIVEAMLGRSPNPEAVTVWLENMTGEEKSVARLIIARVYPDTAHIAWLDDVPDHLPRLSAEILRLLTAPARKSFIETYLREHPLIAGEYRCLVEN